MLYWVRKPGTQLTRGKDLQEEQAEGRRRRVALLESIARQIQHGLVGPALAGGQG